ncbi:MAG TPA: hypothetical protein VMY40_00830 [Anaerolineae bacterium]|nr:hypothetical protein [Anaerolineae bacterium]
MRQLKINWTELEAAFQMSSWEMHHYLDLETGDVLVVTDEAARYVEEPPDSELSEWMQEMVKVARTLAKVCRHISGRKCSRLPGIFTLTRLFATFARVAE